MTNERIDTSDQKSGSRYVWLTKYEMETASDRENNDGASNMKNFPRAFIPMEELEQSLSGE